MSYGTEYQRYKQKLERLQSKVKRSENARKELEIRLQRLMKERNECEKTATIHKSKYNSLLEHERKRLSRNGELLEMLEEVHAKATAMASNTEKLKKLKNQQERILVNNWRRSAYMQPHIFYPNVLYPNAAQYVSPVPITYEHQHRAIDSIPIENCSPVTYERPPYFVEANGHPPQVIKSTIDVPVQQPTVFNQIPYSSLMPIYHSEPFNPRSNSMHFRYENQNYNQQTFTPAEKVDASVPNTSDTNQTKAKEMPSNNQSRINQSALYSNHINNDMANVLNDGTNYIKTSTSILSQSDLASTIGQPEKYKFDLEKSQQKFNKFSSYLPSEHDNYIRSPNINHSNQYSQAEESASQVSNVPSITAHDSKPMSEIMSRFLANDQHTQKPFQPSMYDTDMKRMTADTKRDSLEHRNNEASKVTYQDTYSSLPRVESNDVKNSLNTTTTSDTNVITSSTQKGGNFTFHEDTKHFPSSVTTSTFDDSATKSPYENATDPIYTSVYSKNTDGVENTLKSTNFRTNYMEKSTKIDDKSEKRRGSIDAESFAKTLGYDSDIEKESIAANIRRRYSVAANFLNLPSSGTEFNFTPSSLNEYKDTSNLKNAPTQNMFDGKTNVDETFYSGGENKMGDIDLGSIRKENNMSRSIDTNYIDPPVSMMNAPTSQFIPEAVNDTNDSHTATELSDHVNIDDGNTEYSSYAMDDQNYVENSMQQLSLGDNIEPEPADEIQTKQFDDIGDKARAHATHNKTVSWADDPNSNYKNEDTPQVYDTHDVANEQPVDSYYPNNTELQAIPHEYTSDGTIEPNTETSDAQYQYDSNQYDNQYENTQYQTSDGAANQSGYDEYYYANEQNNQYDQYGVQQHQEEPQQLQYYENNAVGENNGTINMNQTDDGYQQYQTDPNLQPQPKHDDYYTVQPGENYYSDYGNVDDNQTYSTNTNIGNSSEISSFSTGPVDQQQILVQQPDIQYTSQTEQMAIPHVPNYLQSDTDDSQTGSKNVTNNRIPQSQDSDFDFSTNS